MKIINTRTLAVYLLTMLITPVLTFAATATNNFLGTNSTGGEIGTSLDSVIKFLNNVVIPFILAIGFFMFVWGIFNYFILGGANDDAKEKGKSLIIYALAGFVVILAFWGIVNIFVAGVGLSGETLQYDASNSLIKTE